MAKTYNGWHSQDMLGLVCTDRLPVEFTWLLISQANPSYSFLHGVKVICAYERETEVGEPCKITECTGAYDAFQVGLRHGFFLLVQVIAVLLWAWSS